MPLTSEQKGIIRNHLPTIVRHIGVFLTIMDLEVDEGIRKAMLLELIDHMEGDLAGVKQIIENL